MDLGLIVSKQVADGDGQMLVTSVGMNTTWGQIMSTISHDIDKQTPVQARLSKLASWIDKGRFFEAFVILIVMVVRHVRGNPNEMPDASNIAELSLLFRCITTAVPIFFHSIPEGSPLAMTVMLAYLKMKIMAGLVEVPNLAALVNMGFTTTICTDKTGTLTLNQMQVTKFWVGKDKVENSSSISENLVNLIQQGIALNTTGGIYRANSGSEFEFSGCPTEKALLSWAVLELGMDMESIKQNHTILEVEAFNSRKKRSGILTMTNPDNKIHVHWKGAAEMILALCSTYYDASGSVKLWIMMKGRHLRK